MWLLILTYLVDNDRIDELIPAHREFLDRHYADGTFLVSGPQVPRTGGAIVARRVDRATIDKIIAEDPFTVHGAARYDVIEVDAVRTADGIVL